VKRSVSNERLGCYLGVGGETLLVEERDSVGTAGGSRVLGVPADLVTSGRHGDWEVLILDDGNETGTLTPRNRVGSELGEGYSLLTGLK
jgi:hypothetical protein